MIEEIKKQQLLVFTNQTEEAHALPFGVPRVDGAGVRMVLQHSNHQWESIPLGQPAERVGT